MNDYSLLLSKVKPLVDNYRYAHIDSVYELCQQLSSSFELNETDRDNLLTAAILHDVSKGCPDEKQAEFARKLGVSLADCDLATPSVIHAITGAALAKSAFSEFVNDDVLSAVRWHSTGKADMALIDCILFLADYIEPRRKYYNCVMTRNFLSHELDVNPDKLNALYKTMLVCVNFTISELASSKKNIHPCTLELRTFLLRKLGGY